MKKLVISGRKNGCRVYHNIRRSNDLHNAIITGLWRKLRDSLNFQHRRINGNTCRMVHNGARTVEHTTANRPIPRVKTSQCQYSPPYTDTDNKPTDAMGVRGHNMCSKVLLRCDVGSYTIYPTHMSIPQVYKTRANA